MGLYVVSPAESAGKGYQIYLKFVSPQCIFENAEDKCTYCKQLGLSCGPKMPCKKKLEDLKRIGSSWVPSPWLPDGTIITKIAEKMQLLSKEVVVDLVLNEIESYYPDRLQRRFIQPQLPIQPLQFPQYALQQTAFGPGHYPQTAQAPLMMPDQYLGSMHPQQGQPVPGGHRMLRVNQLPNLGPTVIPRNPGVPHLPPSPNIPASSPFLTPQPHPAPLARGDPRGNGGLPAGYNLVFYPFESF